MGAAFRSVRAAVAHARSYEDPIALAAEERVLVGQRDPDDPRWLWCRHPVTDKSGWVPESFLVLDAAGAGSGSAGRAYEAIELSVEAGELLAAGESVAGWTWCVKADGSAGWVPDGKLGTGG